MKIQFTHDFQGKITGNGLFYVAGTVLDVEDEIGVALIAQQHAVAVDAPEMAEPDVDPEPIAEQPAEPVLDVEPIVADVPAESSVEKGSRRRVQSA